MKEKKLFGIGAVALMILVALAPAINSIKVGAEKMNEKKISTMGADLELTIDNCEYREYRPIPRNCTGFDKVEYNLTYTVTNVEYYIFESRNVSFELSVTYIDNSTKIIETWDEKIPILYPHCYPNHSVTLQKSIELVSDKDPANDQERYFGGNIFKLKFLDSYDNNPSNDFDYKFAIHWKDKEDYIPTEPEVMVSVPHNGIKKTRDDVPGLFYWDITSFYDGRILPNILLSKRMGWLGQLTKFLCAISIDLGILFGISATCIKVMIPEFTAMGTWIKDILEWLWCLIKGIWIPGKFIELIKNFVDYVIPATKNLYYKVAACAIAMVPFASELWNNINITYDWTLDEPWTRPITIEGRISNVKPNEIVTVSCRNATETYTDETGFGHLDYLLIVSSEPIPPEKQYMSNHNCQISVTGTMHNGMTISRPLLSYAFSNGSLYWEFNEPGGDSKSVSKSFIIRLINWFKDRPIFVIFQNLFGIKTEQQISSSINYDFNLDTTNIY
jgi:hypothetical protein